MARPRKDQNIVPAKKRILDAATEMFMTTPIDLMSIREICEKAGCNRSTFYYYFDNVYDLLDELIDKTIPKEIFPLIIRLFFALPTNANASDRSAAEIIQKVEVLFEQQEEQIDTMGRLLNGPVGQRVKARSLERAQLFWQSQLGFEFSSAPMELKVIFQFVTNGMMGLLGFRVAQEPYIPIRKLVGILIPTLPNAIFSLIREYLPDDSPFASPRSETKHRPQP